MQMEQEIKTALKPLIEKIKTSDKDKIHTEEEVKQSFVLPFLHALGYNVFDTNVIKPEYRHWHKERRKSRLCDFK